LLEHPTSAQAGGYSLSSFLTNPTSGSGLASMVGDLLEQHAGDNGTIQVTGKVALQNSSSSSSSVSASAGAPTGSGTTSVIRRSPDSPDSGNEDSSAWFLRQVLHQQQQQQSKRDEEDSSSPLTPATSPARGIRRPRHSSSSSNSSTGSEGQIEELEEEDLDDLKKEDLSSAEDEQERNKRARVETIISTMRTSTPATNQHIAANSTLATSATTGSSSINGCKKRKLYQPQQHGKFTSEGEEEEEGDETTDERNDSLISAEEQQQQQHETGRAQGASSRSSSLHHRDVMMQQHDPIRSLQERIASLHQQRFAALQQQQHQQQKPVEQPQQIRRPVRDDAGRTRNPLQQQQHQHLGMRPSLPNDLSHVSQAHAAYIDATRRLLMEQQQRQQQPINRPAQPVIQPVQPLQQQQQREVKEQSVGNELEGLAEMLKSELASSLAQLVDNTLSRFAAQQRKAGILANNKLSEQESELSKLQRGRVIDRGLRNGDLAALGLTSPFLRTPYGPSPALGQQPQLFPQQAQQPSPNAALNHIVNSIAGAGIVHPAVAGLAGSFAPQQPATQHDDADDAADEAAIEQNEALSLVVSPKKRRFNNNHKEQEEKGSPSRRSPDQPQQTRLISPLEISLINHSSSAQSPPPSRTPTPPTQQRASVAQQSLPSAGPPPPLLHHPNLFTNYSAYFAAAAAAAAHQHQQAQQASRSKSPSELDLTSPSTSSLLHPALLASHHHHSRHHHHSQHDSQIDRHSESSDGASPYSGGGIHQSSTLTPMHLRKAKLMFFWCRYPSSSVLKTFFPDVNFNKNNTAQLVKWFSNFR